MLNRFADRTAQITPFYVMELLARAQQLEAQGKDIIHLEVGEPDFPTPQPIVEAGLKQLATGNIKYTPAAGLLQLREKIAAYYHDHSGEKVDEGRIFITPGASGALLLALAATVNAGDEILLPDPCYPCNGNFIRVFGGLAKTVPVGPETAYQLTAELIDQHWSAQSCGVLLASPSNPTGTLVATKALKQCVQTVRSKDGYVFSDEIYHGLTYGTDSSTALEYGENVFVINSFSKYFGMTGWRIGWLVVPEAFIETIEKLAQNLFIATPTLSQYAALAAFETETLVELERRRTELANRRDFLYNALQNLGFEIPVKPDGAFYIYANCAKFTQDSYDFALNLLEREGVAITPGKDFGKHLAEQHMRFAYTTTVERMAEAVLRLERYLNRI